MATNFVSQAKHKQCVIFAIFTPYESVLGVDDRSEFFSISQGMLPWQPILCRTGAEVSQDLLDRFSQSSHHMVGIELKIINPTFFFRYLKGH